MFAPYVCIFKVARIDSWVSWQIHRTFRSALFSCLCQLLGASPITIVAILQIWVPEFVCVCFKCTRDDTLTHTEARLRHSNDIFAVRFSVQFHAIAAQIVCPKRAQLVTSLAKRSRLRNALKSHTHTYPILNAHNAHCPSIWCVSIYYTDYRIWSHDTLGTLWIVQYTAENYWEPHFVWFASTSSRTLLMFDCLA